jgi:adenylate cyclase
MVLPVIFYIRCMLSAKTNRSIFRIIPYGVIWLVFSMVYTLLEKGLLGQLNYYPGTGNPYSFGSALLVTTVTASVTGLFVGTLEILYISKRFMHMSFGKKILYKSVLYLVIILLFLLFVAAVANALQLGAGIFSRQVWDIVWAFFFSYSLLSVVLYITAIVVVTQFYVEVSENVSLSVLQNFFTGKYHKPIQEERIFMFLDMKSSTTIAESIGHIRYFEMLKEYYSDLSEPVVKYYGEVYQYAGDEIIISWTLKNGLQNNHCVECFFAMKAALRAQTGKYQEKFGLLPAFKAGFHLGMVTTGEIGVLKKEIVFTGDVLNTTARIQGLCNTYNVDNLLSGELLDKLHLPASFQIQSLGEHTLRGRDEKIPLFSLGCAGDGC